MICVGVYIFLPMILGGVHARDDQYMLVLIERAVVQSKISNLDGIMGYNEVFTQVQVGWARHCYASTGSIFYSLYAFEGTSGLESAYGSSGLFMLAC